MVAKADIAILEARDGLDLPAEEIFERMDYYKRGYIIGTDLSQFLRTHCNFDVTEEQVARIHPYLDNRGSYYISKENFMNATCAPAQEESEDMNARGDMSE
jgi:Ca2+-binding EF-hand superfamily protein